MISAKRITAVRIAAQRIGKALTGLIGGLFVNSVLQETGTLQDNTILGEPQFIFAGNVSGLLFAKNQFLPAKYEIKI